MNQVLCTAEAFGFGPAAKLCTFMERLAPTGWRTTFLGDRCAFELCCAGPFDRLVRASPRNLRSGSPLRREIAGHDALISAMEFSPIGAARRAGLKTIVIDSLFWMWPSIPCRLDDVDLYLCQNFLGVPERCAGLPRDKVVIMPPLTCSTGPAPGRADVAILNFGGMDNPMAPPQQQLDYAGCLLEIVANACRRVGLRLEVYGGRHVTRRMDPRTVGPVEVLDSLPLPRFVDRLRQARALITSPGLETIYEGFTLGVPVFLLPPQNNSQAYQADLLQQQMPLLPGPQYPDLLGVPALSMAMAPAAAISQVLAYVRDLRGTAAARDRLDRSLHDFLTQPDAAAQRQCAAQSGFMEQMCRTADIRDMPGVRQRIAATVGGRPPSVPLGPR